MQDKSLSLVTVIPAQVSAEAGRFTPSNDLSTMSFWDNLTPHKRELIQEEVKQLAAARMMHTSSGLAIGKHLRNIYNTCEPYSGAFRKILKSFAFVERTAYRYMETYDNAKDAFPENILKAAMARGLNVLSYDKEQPLGKYTEVVRLLPPPRNPDPSEAKRYVEQLEKTYKDRKKAMLASGTRGSAPSATRTKNELLKQNFRSIKNALSHLPARQRRAFIDTLFGMTLTEAGISSKVTFEPEAIPDDFRQGPGRPRMESETAA